mmetsp:Transcript_73989/g.139860  ORF Transcript_73989/g.139860 Transcript_73989/m.139860 type:complete len:468 (+) Transcript_73989:167-1570(+)
MPKRPARKQKPAPARLRSGNVGLVVLGRTRVRVPFAGYSGTFKGTVVEFCKPWFKVLFTDGDSADYTGHELAQFIVFRDEDFYEPSLWYYDFSVINPADIPGWNKACRTFCDSFGVETPNAWLGDATNLETAVGDPTAESADDFRQRERLELQSAHRGFLGLAREKRTISNLRNPALKLLWWCASRRCNFPPSANDVALYCAKLATSQNTIGAVASAKNALSYTCAFNEMPTREYDSVRVNAALEAMRRRHKHQVKKAAGLSVHMVRAIMKAYGVVVPHRPATRQWQFAVGTSIGLGFKLLLRYDDLKRCRWDDGYCEVFATHVRFYLDGRKNNMYGGDFLDVAAPADPRERGVYHLCVEARALFLSGFVLACVDARGNVDTSKPMSYSTFVRHLREALVLIGLSRETAAVYSAHSMRSGGATTAARQGLSREEIQHLAGVKDVNWLAYYNRMHLAERLRVSQGIGL